MTPTDTQVGDQWGADLEVVGYGWRPLGLGYKVVGKTVEHPYDAHPLVRLADVRAVITAARQGRGGYEAAEQRSEPKPSQHPIRGEGEPVAYRWAYFGHNRKIRWTLSTRPHAACEPNARQCGVIVEPLYAHPPTSYEGEGLRTDIEIVREWVAEDHGQGQFQKAIDAFDRILQALQSASKP